MRLGAHGRIQAAVRVVQSLLDHIVGGTLDGRQRVRVRGGTFGWRDTRQRRRTAADLDLIFPVAVDAECHHRCTARDGQRRTRRRQSGNSTGHVRDLMYRPAADVEAIDVADPVGIGDEVDARAVARPLRVQVLRTRQSRQRTDRAGLCLDESQLGCTERKRRQVARESIRDERYPLSIRRPFRLQIRVRIVCEPAQLAVAQIVKIEIRDPTFESGKGEGVAVRRPRWRENLAELWKSDLPFLFLPFDVEDHQARLPVFDGGKDKPISTRTPGTCRPKRLQAFESRRSRRGHQLPLNHARLGVGQEEIE